MSLDEKIRELVTEDTMAYEIDEKIALVKQAFTDEGYSTPVDENDLINFGTKDNPVMIHKDSLPFSPNSDGGYIEIPKDLRLTGQEWYDKFEKELWKPPVQQRIQHNDDGESHDRFYRTGGQNFMYDAALEAAKKASGIK